MCAVFKFSSNVEEFSIALDCDKSELSVVLTCKDGVNLHSLACLLFRGRSAPVCFRCLIDCLERADRLCATDDSLQGIACPLC